MKSQFVTIIFVFFLLSLLSSLCQSIGECGNDTPCPPGLCCSQYGYCGTGPDYCGSPPPPSPPPPPPPPVGPPSPPPPSGEDLSSVISKAMFEEMLKNRNDPLCPAAGFYTYESFIEAAKIYPAFGNTGDMETRKREVAAFMGQTSHETTGGWAGAPGGEFSWGYCFKEQQDKSDDHCNDITFPLWPCVLGKKYFGRGPMQLSWNYNYGPFGQSIRIDLLSYPDLVAEDATISFEAALWFWMTPQYPKPSCHDVIVGNWIPTQCDLDANRRPGFGVITNIINGGIECDGGNPSQVENRIGYYTRYCDLFGISHGANMDCADQRPFSDPCTSPAPNNIEMVVASA